MAAISNQSSWRDRAIQRSEVITDGWEVTKTYAGRLAEWVLFLCMIFCIVEILPGVNMAVWMSNTVLGVQAVMLDIGGFALSSMADQARSNGDEQAAHKADLTGRFLIGIVILTLTLITIGLLYAPAKPYTDGAEKVLILVRVMMTVVYGHVIHSLRRTTPLAIQPTQPPTQLRDIAKIDELTAMVGGLQEQLSEALHRLPTTHETPLATQVAIQPIQVPTQPTYLLLDVGKTNNLLNLEEDEPAVESGREASAERVYPDVPGVSPEKVRSIIEAFESGEKWRAIPGNYSQTIKPVRDAYERLHNDLHAPTQNV